MPETTFQIRVRAEGEEIFATPVLDAEPGDEVMIFVKSDSMKADHIAFKLTEDALFIEKVKDEEVVSSVVQSWEEVGDA